MNYVLRLSQIQRIAFVMVNAAGVEVPGLGAGFTLELAKGGVGFIASTGVKAEIGSGWYRYDLTALETDTVGVLAVRVNGAGCVQQNLVYFVQEATPGGITFTYTVTNIITGLPLDGVTVTITADITGTLFVWTGVTDALGIARDADGNLPVLSPGGYFFWRNKTGFSFTDPDFEVVSP